MEGVQGEGRLQGWGAPTGLRAVFGASVNTKYEHPGAAFEGLPWDPPEGSQVGFLEEGASEVFLGEQGHFGGEGTK